MSRASCRAAPQGSARGTTDHIVPADSPSRRHRRRRQHKAITTTTRPHNNNQSAQCDKPDAAGGSAE